MGGKDEVSEAERARLDQGRLSRCVTPSGDLAPVRGGGRHSRRRGPQAGGGLSTSSWRMLYNFLQATELRVVLLYNRAELFLFQK